MNQLEIERNQLIACWRWRLFRQPNWIDKQWNQVRRVLAASQGDPVHDEDDLDSQLRQFHNHLGFKAWGTNPKRGGLCAGTIFRTPGFIKIEHRKGTMKPIGRKTVHIEHTYPVRMLCAAIRERQFEDYPRALAWLLKHSVTTAFREGEQDHLLGKSRSWSGALDPRSSDYLKPFMRYDKLWKCIGTVWNVFDLKAGGGKGAKSNGCRSH